MGSILVRSNGSFSAKIRINGFPAESKTFKSRDECEIWMFEREAFLRTVQKGQSSKTTGQYLHVKTGKPRAILLRPYQDAAVTETHLALISRPKSSPLVSLPTASGKTIVIAALIERLLEFQPQARFLVLTHTKELVDQDYQKFITYSCLPEDCVGIASSSFGRFEMDKQVIFATIQSIALREFRENIDYIFIDEAHLLPESEESQYRRTLSAAKSINTKLRVIGFTATPFRTDSGLMIEGENSLFTEISYEANIKDLIRDKYLSLIISSGSRLHVNESALVIDGVDFDESISEREMMGITPEILAQISQQGSARKAWMVFCVSIAHAKQVSYALNNFGIQSKVVSSEESADDRKEIIKQFKEGKIRALVNVNILTTGFDAPNVDLIVSLRPTISTSLWVQICGRGMRIAKGKQNCLVLDFANNIARHGPIDEIRVTGREHINSSKEALKKLAPCPTCNTLCGPRVHVCPNCNTPLNGKKIINLDNIASTLPILRLDGGSLSKVHRLEDLRNIIQDHFISDISEKLRIAMKSNSYLEDFYQALPTYQLYLDKSGINYFVENKEFAFTIDEVAVEIGKSKVEILDEIDRNIFPKPRLIFETNLEEKGYSMLQLAAIKAGLAGKLLDCDVSILWYQHMSSIIELDLLV